ncbi:MAG: hypothetical protein EU533_01660 [Promethearchaeota archaeon]|nr:MAG: hypothetical protein EU533_01660 [Candidatus Lokiarchaeota archaeon]
MDSGDDFLSPELLNLIFFQQKSIVVFPYVDQKHLKSLETFAVGHSVIDIDCTVINDVGSIIEHESGTYSQNPNLYFIYNASKDIIASLHDRENVHCIINTHEDVSNLVSDHSLIFYNKKYKKFLNWNYNSNELTFEKKLIEQSKGEASLLHDLLVQIKSFATRIYTIIAETNNYPSIPLLFNEQADIYPPEYWERILEFMEMYHAIKTPQEIIEGLNQLKLTYNSGIKVRAISEKIALEDFSPEYDLIIATDKFISNAFIHALLEYRSKYVNSANLELTQLYNPRALYNYLRNHHWKEMIDDRFINEWFKNPDIITDDNSRNVKIMLKKLGISYELIIQEPVEELSYNGEINFESTKTIEKIEDKRISSYQEIPSIKDFTRFKEWILDKLEEVERIISKKG